MATMKDLQPGTKILFHGGWKGDGEKCTGCNFHCGFTFLGEIVEQYSIYDQKSDRLIPHPDLWTSKLETGAFAVGYSEQYELV